MNHMKKLAQLINIGVMDDVILFFLFFGFFSEWNKENKNKCFGLVPYSRVVKHMAQGPWQAHQRVQHGPLGDFEKNKNLIGEEILTFNVICCK